MAPSQRAVLGHSIVFRPDSNQTVTVIGFLWLHDTLKTTEVCPRTTVEVRSLNQSAS